MSVLSKQPPGPNSLVIRGRGTDLRTFLADMATKDAMKEKQVERRVLYAIVPVLGLLGLMVFDKLAPTVVYSGLFVCVLALVTLASMASSKPTNDKGKLGILDEMLAALEPLLKEQEVGLTVDLAPVEKTGKRVAHSRGMGDGLELLYTKRESSYEQPWLEMVWTLKDDVQLELTAERWLHVISVRERNYQRIEREAADLMRVFLKNPTTGAGHTDLASVESDLNGNFHIEIATVTRSEQSWLEVNFKEQMRPEHSDKALVYWAEWLAERKTLQAPTSALTP